MKTAPIFSVFTPTYNRWHTLHRVYQSLSAQTCDSFEWIIIDDGSTDKTRALIEQWQNEKNMAIQYFWQENQGKHIAFNTALQCAMGKYFIILDSDDGCMPTALEKFLKHWDELEKQGVASEFASVVCRCSDENHTPIGSCFPNAPLTSTRLDVDYRLSCYFEKWEASRLECLKELPFPAVKDTTHVPESMLWDRLSMRYKSLFINDSLRIYYQNNSASSDQLTKHVNYKKSAGKIAYYIFALNETITFLHHAPLRFFIHAIQYLRISFHHKSSLFSALQKITNKRAIFLIFFSAPIAYSLYWYDKISIDN